MVLSWTKSIKDIYNMSKVQLQKQSVDLYICFLMKPWVFDS